MGENKRGQFYLIAAFVIIGIILGYVAVSNYSKVKENIATLDLAKTLKIESAKVLDYGVYNENIGVDQMKNLLEGFIQEYSKIGQIEELYFIFGNYDTLVFMGYQQLEDEILVDVIIDGTPHPLEVGKRKVDPKSFTAATYKKIEKVVVSIAGQKYVFTLKEGENFYFILSQVVKGEKYVIVGDDEGSIWKDGEK